VDNAQAYALISGWDWTFVQITPQCPHWYVVRSPENEAAFVAFVEHIQHHGVTEKLGEHTYTCSLYHGDHKYWTMGISIPKTTFINRVLIKEGEDRLAEKGTSQNALGEAKGVGLRIKVKS
jgi:hypothetical protein